MNECVAGRPAGIVLYCRYLSFRYKSSVAVTHEPIYRKNTKY